MSTAWPVNDKHREDIIRSHYEPRFDRYDEAFRILDWEDSVSHEKRFEVLTENVDLDGMKLLDVGCGLGDLYGFLMQKNISCDYTGVDLLERMVEAARIRYPKVEFLQGNVFAEDIFPSKTFDVAFSSGIFNLNLGNNRSFLKDAVGKLLQLSEEAVVFNCLDRASPDPDQRYYYFTPGEIRKLLADYPVSVTIVSGYLGNDLTTICRHVS